jgi:hypothetical protein
MFELAALQRHASTKPLAHSHAWGLAAQSLAHLTTVAPVQLSCTLRHQGPHCVFDGGCTCGVEPDPVCLLVCLTVLQVACCPVHCSSTQAPSS